MNQNRLEFLSVKIQASCYLSPLLKSLLLIKTSIASFHSANRESSINLLEIGDKACSSSEL